MSNDLWSGLDIEVIGGTGEFGSGKTLFGLLISPGPRTRVYDQEGSATIYKQLGFQHVDVAKEMQKRFAVQQGSTVRYKPIDVFKWWLSDAMAIQPGSLDVVMIDPVSEIEDGLCDYVRANISEFGLTQEQLKKSSGLFWGAVKSYWKTILNDLRARCKTLYFTSHMRYKYVGNVPTREREAKGKETLAELASLYLRFERKAGPDGIIPEIPSATYEAAKNRLCHFAVQNGVLTPHPVLPPRIPQCTPDAIRWYIANPPNYLNLKPEERIVEKRLSDDEKLAMQAQIAEANREAAQAELSKFQMIQQAALSPQSVPVAAAPPVGENANVSAEVTLQCPPATNGQIDEPTLLGIRTLLEQLQPDPAAIGKMLAHYGCQRFQELSREQGIDVMMGLRRVLDSRPQPKPPSPAVVAQERLAEADNFFRTNLEGKASGTH